MNWKAAAKRQRARRRRGEQIHTEVYNLFRFSSDVKDSLLDRQRLGLIAAKHLLLAAKGPDGGPTDWNETRERWMDEFGGVRE